jgi:5S rRNA maturation endonuclease (ribonuclease M5)
METSKRARQRLEPFLIGGQEISPGEWDMRCPLHDDKKRSARVNFDKGVWKCFAGCGHGSLTGLLKRLGSSPQADPQPKTKQSKAPAVTQEQVDRWHLNLINDEHATEYLWSERGISEQIITEYLLGFDRASQAFTIPVYLQNGDLFNVRKYRPNAPSDRKIWWASKKEPGITVPLYPEHVLEDTDWVVITEGEMDALIANQFDFPAVSGTAGAGTWHVEWSERFKDKRVFIVYDRDSPGERGAKMVAEHLEPFASAIWIVKIPIRKKGADVTDYFVKYPHSHEDFNELLRKSRPFQKRIADPMNEEERKVSVMESFDSQNIGHAQGMDVLILGKTKEMYALPKVVTSVCTMDAGPRCKFCPMLGRRGKHNYEISPSSQTILTMMDSSISVRNEALRQHVGAVKCDRIQHEVKSHQTIEQLFVRPSWDEHSGDFTPRKIISVGKHNTMPSQVVHVVGTTHPDPKRQVNEFMAWEVREAENAIDEFRVTPDIVKSLRQFRPRGDQTPLQKMGDIALDLEQHVTRIYGRLDLHMAVDVVFHSLISFPFQGKLERRGWLDALVIGDTRTGKSEVAQRVLEHYRTGQFVNCEAATFAGVIGGLQQMADRQWAVTWGVVPMSDRRLVVLDEASGLSQEEIQKMSDVRSRGVIKMAKIQADQAWARTRLLWLSNPRNESMDRYMYGVQAIQPLIGNREDIARFDFAMALTTREVDMDQIYQAPSRRTPKYASEDCHMRVIWAWSRAAEDVEWEPGAERLVLKGAEWLGEQYVADPPLLQAANAHVKTARIAAALAAATFSTDSTGRFVIIKKQHVKDAVRFIHHIYSKDTFGYHRMSDKARDQRKRAAANAQRAKSYLLENRMLVEFLQGVEGQFRRDLIEQMVNVSREEANGIVNRLFAWGLVSPNGYAIKMNPALHELLREMEEEGI